MHTRVQSWVLTDVPRQEASSLIPPPRPAARSNYGRILDAAREELISNPDASLEEIARAAGVVRRTVYGHFPNREALISALAAEAGQVVAAALARARREDAEPPEALARAALTSWAVADRYRILIVLGRRQLGEDALARTAAPAQAEALAIIERGQADGTIADHLPAPVLAAVVEGVVLAVLNSDAIDLRGDLTGQALATAVLVAVGIAPVTARARVQDALSSMSDTLPAVAGNRADEGEPEHDRC